MSDRELDAKQIESKVSDLANAMEEVRDRQAARDDVVVEMKQARLARLELLARDLQPVFREVPDDNDQFEFALTRGENPRLWIDMTSHIRMSRDRREYEFVKDTRMGRTILGRYEDREQMGKLVTRYVAERMLERERAMEGEWVQLHDYDFDGDDATTERESEDVPSPTRSNSWLLWLLIGLAVGVAAMFGWAEYGEVIQAYLNDSLG